MQTFFETKQLSVGYNKCPVIEHIDVQLEKGQILTLIGPNGSGKSTILKSITSQLELLAGVVMIDTHSIEKIDKREMARRMAVVLTERPKPELLTCEDVVALGRYPYTGMLGMLSEHDKGKVAEALTMVNAIDIKDRSFSEISDGQLQRIMLARAICQEPEIIVLDEPTSFLDVRYALEILDILREMTSKHGVTVIMSLHELNYAKRISDLVMCIKDGCVLYLDTPDAIFNEAVISHLYDLPKGSYHELFGGL